VAIIACHWIGDTLWAVQTVEPLRRRFPAADLYAVTKPACIDLWNGRLPAERVLPAAEVVSDRRRERVSWRRLRRRARELRGLACDVVVDLTGNRYSAAMSFLLRPAASLGFDGGELGGLYSVRVADAERPGEHLSQRPFRAIEPLLDAWDEPFAYRGAPQPPEPTRSPAEVRSELDLADRPYCVLAPGAGWAAKQWSADAFRRLAELVAKTGCGVVVVGSGAERDLCEYVAAGAAGAKVAAGRPLGEVVALLSEARGVAANDSGIGHLAAALGRPTASIFTGETNPALCRPLGPPDCVEVFALGATPEDVAAVICT
jgi:ADP-heptose:LPS heptosyltransferase